MAYTKEIVLGSGKLYCIPYVPGTVIGSLADYCIEDNRIGLIQGGAQISYTPTVYEVKDDMNVIYKRFITAEEATLTSGILTWNLDALNSFIGNKYFYINDEGNKVMKLGGSGAREMDEYLVVFCHEFRNKNKIYVGMAATNDAGLTLAFQPDKETVIDAEFRAISNDDGGCILIIEEEEYDSTLTVPATIAGGDASSDLNVTITISGGIGRVYASADDYQEVGVVCSVSADNTSCSVYIPGSATGYNIDNPLTITFTDSTAGTPQTAETQITFTNDEP